jgi:hypothetical protein
MNWMVLWTDNATGSTGYYEYSTREKARVARREFQANAKEVSANYSYSVKRRIHGAA